MLSQESEFSLGLISCRDVRLSIRPSFVLFRDQSNCHWAAVNISRDNSPHSSRYVEPSIYASLYNHRQRSAVPRLHHPHQTVVNGNSSASPVQNDAKRT